MCLYSILYSILITEHNWYCVLGVSGCAVEGMIFFKILRKHRNMVTCRQYRYVMPPEQKMKNNKTLQPVKFLQNNTLVLYAVTD